MTELTEAVYVLESRRGGLLPMATVKQGGRQMSVGTTTARILRGEDDLSEWSEAELVRGQRRLADGSFPSRRPTVVATALHDELVKRRLGKAIRLLKVSTPHAIRLLVKVVRDEEAATRDRIKAAELILDRALGKAPQHVDLRLDTETLAPWQRMMASAIVSTESQVRALPAGEVIDVEGEIVDAEIVEPDSFWLPHGPVSDDWQLDDTPPPDAFTAQNRHAEPPKVVRPKWYTGE